MVKAVALSGLQQEFPSELVLLAVCRSPVGQRAVTTSRQGGEHRPRIHVRLGGLHRAQQGQDPSLHDRRGCSKQRMAGGQRAHARSHLHMLSPHACLSLCAFSVGWKR